MSKGPHISVVGGWVTLAVVAIFVLSDLSQKSTQPSAAEAIMGPDSAIIAVDSDTLCLQSMENFQALQDSIVVEYRIVPVDTILADALIHRMFLRAQEITGLCTEMVETRFAADSVVQSRFQSARNFVDWVESGRKRKQAPGRSA